MLGQFKLHGKFHLSEDAELYAVAGQRELFTASWSIRATYRDATDRVREVKLASSVGMQVDLWNQKEQTMLLELIAGLMTAKLAEISKEKSVSVMVGIEVANEQRDKYLSHPVVSYSFLNFHEFSAADFLS